MTFDDGPFLYTTHILDLLDRYNAKATFFITGNNLGKGEIDVESNGYAAIIKRMYKSGHQIASHTWSHQDLSLLDLDGMKKQIHYNEMALRNILGFFPQYMRPPYSNCNTACQDFLAATGYHIVYFNLDSEDYLYNDRNTIRIPMNDISGNVSARGDPSVNKFLVIEHDIHYTTAYNLTEHTLKEFQARGFHMVTVGDCLGDPRSNWYRSSNDKPPTSTTSDAVVAPTSISTSTTGRCGASVGMNCQGSSFGNCCSPAGWW